MENLKQKAEIKQLESLQLRLENKISNLELQYSQVEKELSILKQELERVNQKLHVLRTTKELVLSEQALLHYIEQVLKVDLEAVRESVVTDEQLLQQVALLGNGTYPMDNGAFKVVVRDQLIEDIMGSDEE